MKSSIFLRSIPLLSLLVALAPRAHAAPMEEVIVSDFRPANRDATPASVAVLDAELIGETVVQHFEELTHLVPNLNWAGGVSRPRYFQIRGIGERSQYEGAPNPSVGFLVDDLDFSALGGVATMFDVDQVEVLRGPQGTRYGANALAGLIYVKYREPGDEFEMTMSGTAGSDDARALGVALGGPVTDALAWRAVVHRHRSDGFRDNAFLGRSDTNGRDELSTRIKLRYRPGDNWQASLTALHADLDNGYDAFAIDNGFTTQSDRPGRDAQRSLGGVLRIEGDIDERLSLVSITGAARSDVTFSFDADWGNDEFWAPFVYDFYSATDRDRENLSQEVRLYSAPGAGLAGGRIDFVVGAQVNRLRESNLTLDDGDFEGFAFASSIAREYEATSSALFGELDLPLGDRLALNAGLRFERRDARYQDTAGDRFDPREDSFGGQLALRYALGDDIGVYGRIARGYKAGGFNLGLPADAGADTLLFDAEYLWNYEVGIDARLLDGRLRFDAAAFLMERRDQQVQSSAQLDPANPATFVFFTDNAGEGRNLGLELSAEYLASEALSLYANIGLLDTRIDEFGARTDLVGRDQAHAPNYTFAAGARLDFARDWFGRLDLAGKDEFYFSDSHDQRSDPYTLVNARFGIEKSNWSAYLWGRNLTDERYAVRGFFFGNEPARDFADTLYTRLGDPRQIGVSFDYRYAP